MSFPSVDGRKLEGQKMASILSIGQSDVDWQPKRKPDGYFDAKRRGFGKLYPLVAERLKG